MPPEDNQQGAPNRPPEESADESKSPVSPESEPEGTVSREDGADAAADGESSAGSPPETPSDRATAPEADSSYEEDAYGYMEEAGQEVVEPAKKPVTTESQASRTPPTTPPVTANSDDDEDADEEGMLRMSFMEHLEELRNRLVRSLMGVGVAFLLSLVFARDLWRIVSEPAVDALTKLGYENATLAQIRPTDTFATVWVKLPILTAVFLASPWILYQAWAFIAPGLYKRERRWAAPFVISTAGLFIIGGLFAYFVAFRFGLTFLLGIGRDLNITPYVSITDYFNLFVNVSLGLGLIFELPVLIFFLILVRIVTPAFLVKNSRYAILIIVIIAAVITPTPDVVNLMIFSLPMCLLYFLGVFAGYILNLHRDKQRFPWMATIIILAVVLLSAGAAWVYLAVTRYGYHIENAWPFLTR